MSNIPMQCALHNIQRTALALAQLGIASVEVTYEGSGDSGGLEDIEYFDAAGDAVKPASDNVTDTLKAIGYDYTASSWQAAERDQECTGLLAMVTLTTLTAIEAAGHGGWEINEGGRGSFTILANGAARLCHDSYVEGEEQDTTHYNVADLTKPEAELTAEKKALLESIQKTARHLTQKGAAWAAVHYSGSGDSGGVDEFLAEDANGNAIASPKVFGLDRLLDDVLEDISRSGFENNEGGRGTLTVRADGTATIEHFDVIEETESSEHTFGAWQNENEAVETA